MRNGDSNADTTSTSPELHFRFADQSIIGGRKARHFDAVSLNQFPEATLVGVLCVAALVDDQPELSSAAAKGDVVVVPLPWFPTLLLLSMKEFVKKRPEDLPGFPIEVVAVQSDLRQEAEAIVTMAKMSQASPSQEIDRK